MLISILINLAFILNSTRVETQKPLPVVKKQEIVKQEIPKRIVVKSVNIDLPVIESPFKDGSWIADEHYASYAQGTPALNSSNGNTLIFAHARSKIFKPIIETKEGDIINIYSQTKIYYYKIVDREIISPYNIEALKSHAKHIVTLLTCIGENDENRLMLQGELIGLSENKLEEVI